MFKGSIEITKYDPVVPYKETVASKSSQSMDKSPNKHNRLYVIAESLNEELIKEI